MTLRGAVSVLGRFPALAGVDLDVDRSEVLLVSGPNGAGKSTLLRLCAGLANLAQGEATILGFPLPRRRREVRRRVGYLGHANGLYPELTVAENVRFWSRSVGAPTGDVAAALDRVEVASRLHDLAVAHLSAGQRRRAALACLVVRRPEIWLLDEPHTGLDAAARDLLDALVREAVAGGATALVASHEHERSSSLATREVQLVGGVVTWSRKPNSDERPNEHPDERPNTHPVDTGQADGAPIAVGGGAPHVP
ncbi:MAG: heme ABC exporter ATP-binding protein CcmA [Acidimicrobiales bacterium]|nr:heme ABC exporter ATP-binding protein CcmA [Acidimicrobiales bacterium]